MLEFAFVLLLYLLLQDYQQRNPNAQYVSSSILCLVGYVFCIFVILHMCTILAKRALKLRT